MLPTKSQRTISLSSILLLCLCLLQLTQAQRTEESADLRFGGLSEEVSAINPNLSLDGLFLEPLGAADDAGDDANSVNALQRNNLIAAAAMQETPAPIMRIQATKNSGLRR